MQATIRCPRNGPWHREQDCCKHPNRKRDERSFRLSNVAFEAKDHRPETGDIVAKRPFECSLTRSRRQAREWHRCRHDDAQRMPGGYSEANPDRRTKRKSISEAQVHKVRNDFSRWRMAAVESGPK